MKAKEFEYRLEGTDLSLNFMHANPFGNLFHDHWISLGGIFRQQSAGKAGQDQRQHLREECDAVPQFLE
jgi:hypothetical protein